MKNTFVVTFIIMLTILSCNKNKKENNQPNLNMNNNSENLVYEDTLYKGYAPLMVNFLKDNNFKFPSDEIFNEKVTDLFGVDINKSKFDDVAPLINGSNSYIHNVYSIMRKERFIDFYELDRGIIDGGGDALKDYLTKQRSNDDEFILYNKLLLNDDISTMPFIIKDTFHLQNIVIYFNYEKNTVLNNQLIRTLKHLEDVPDSFKVSLLWYNNLSKKEVIRKKLLSDILINNSEYIFDLSYFLFLNKNNIVPKQNIKYINSTLAYLIEIQLKKDEDKDASSNKGYTLLNNFYVQNNLILKDFQNNSFYNYPSLKKYTELYLSIISQETSQGIIQDPDGFTNLRQEKNAASVILEKVKTGSEIEVLDKTGEWWLVVTKAGNKGYIFKTKIISE